MIQAIQGSQNPLNKNIKILILKNKALGDAVISLGSIQYLKTLFNKSNLTLIYGVPQWIYPLFKHVTTDCEKIIPLTWDSALRNIAQSCDLILELHQSSFGKKFFGSIFSLGLKSKYFFHNHHKKFETIIINQGKPLPAIQRDIEGVWSILRHLNMTNLSCPSPSEFLNFPPRLIPQGLSTIQKKPQIILGVVASRKTKNWPFHYFEQLCHFIKKNYPHFEIIAPLSPKPEDQNLTSIISQFARPVTLPLEELPQLFSESSAYIGNDTGLKHLAVATGLPTLTFFGPDGPHEWHPYDQKKHPYLFCEPLPCRTRQSHFCGLSTCSHHICLEAITPAIAELYLPQILGPIHK
jgi:heptosyltransferase-2